MTMYHYTDGGLRNVWLANGYEIKPTPSGFATVAAKRREHPYYDLWALATVAPMGEAELRALAGAHFP